MGTFMISSVVFFTVLTALAFGILLGYTVILGILRLFGSRRRALAPISAAATAKLVPLSSAQ